MTSPRVLFLSRGFLAMRPVRAEEALPMPANIRPRGQVRLGLNPIDAPATAQRQRHHADGVAQGINDPLLPLAGIRPHARPHGKTNRVSCATAGAATDPADPGRGEVLRAAVFVPAPDVSARPKHP